MNQELKPCPFCGKHEPLLIEKLEDDNWEICCDNRAGGCGAASTQRLEKDKVIKQWNTRAPDSSGIIKGLEMAAQLITNRHGNTVSTPHEIGTLIHVILSTADKLEKENNK